MCICVNNIKYILEEGSKPVIQGIDVDGFLSSLAALSGIEQSATASRNIAQLHIDSKEVIILEISNIFEKTAAKVCKLRMTIFFPLLLHLLTALLLNIN